MSGFWRKSLSAKPAVSSPESKTGASAFAFPGLDEPDLVALYNLAELVKYAPGEQPFGAAQLGSDLIVVLSGQLELRPSKENDNGVQTVVAGDWIGEADFGRLVNAQPAMVEVFARTGGSALVIDANTFDRLDHKLQIYLLRHSKRIARARLGECDQQIKSLNGSITQLAKQIYRLRAERGAGFAQSPLAKKLFAKVPRLPVSSVELLNKMLDDRTTREEIVNLVAQDPGLTGALLKAINSPAYGFSTRITSINQAMLLLGHGQVYQIVMSESMRHSLPDSPVFAEIHQRSIDLSRIAFIMAKVCSGIKPAEISTLAVLAEIGTVIVELLKSSNPQIDPLFEYVDPAPLGAELLRTWKLPETLCKALQYQSYPEFAPPDKVPEDVRMQVTLLYLSRRAYQVLQSSPNLEPGVFLEDYIETMALANWTENRLIFEHMLPRLARERETLPNSLAAMVESWA